MIVERLSVGVYGVNCYIIACKETKEAVVIDPGGNPELILNKLKELNLEIKYIILTHGHGDHIGAVLKLKESYNCKVLIHKDDNEMILNDSLNLSSIMSMENIQFCADNLLNDNDEIILGKLSAKFIHTPGHTKGSMCIKIGNKIFTGDTIFKGSIGRSDLYGGNHNTLIESIKSKLLIYDDNVELYPGHGPFTNIGYERINNPFLNS